jgi:hypothetical protein
MTRKRTVGNRVWIGLLAFCLLVMCALDCCLVYSAFHWVPLLHRVPWGLLLCFYLTGTVYRALRRRISISGSDSFFS